MMEQNMIFCAVLPVSFPEGFYTGNGDRGNSLSVAVAGDGSPVLRGSSLAGVLRHTLATEWDGKILDEYFGKALDNDCGSGSRLVVYDSFFARESCEFSHNRISRHRGAVLDGCVYSIERVMPGVKTNLHLELFVSEAQKEEATEFWQTVLDCFRRSLIIGGASNRGCGRMVLDEKNLRAAKFSMQNPDELAAYHKFNYCYRKSGKADVLPLAVLPPLPEQENIAVWELEFAIPRGQDFLIGGSSETYPVEYGKRWVIPGSSLRGTFRSWIARLMVLDDGIELEDCAQEYDRENEKSADQLEQPSGTDPETLSPLLQLFGSLANKGRLHISDAVSTREQKKEDCQLRKHVTIDRFSGGANSGGLFENFVLISQPDLKFRCTITLRDPQESEVNYLKNTLWALHTGMLRIGTSKAAGRLEVFSCKTVAGKFEMTMDEITEEL